MSPRTAADGLWAITSYFNPMGYRHRRANFRTFREHLSIPLVAVELAYGNEFELTKRDAEIVLQLRGDAILWQKERLLNLGLQALPPQCRKVTWVDCDIIFGAPDWAASAEALLDHFPIIQMYSRVNYLAASAAPGSRQDSKDVEFSRPSFVACVASGLPAATCIAGSIGRRDGTCVNGFAWAARREILDRHGLYDANIIGGGDTAFCAGATNCFEIVMEHQYMNDRQRERYMAWAQPFYETVRGDIGFLEQEINHLWHGRVEDRRARTRHEGLRPFQFDPFNDISFDTNGCWRWNTQKTEMHEYIRQYFLARKEDG
jgi:hypothetical protein